MKIYTLSGDDGTTSLSGGGRVPKHSPRVEAYGCVDEVIAWIGLLRSSAHNCIDQDVLVYIQEQLMLCAAGLSQNPEGKKKTVILPEDSCVSILEQHIDKMQENLPPLKNFVLPGGDLISSYCHIARCVCRRAERAVSFLNSSEHIPLIILKFLNRLSDFLFVLARTISYNTDNEEIKWTAR